ncbi:SHOCT domain-containing protein [Tessaracoccus sp. HDW20]|uniref:SHOCT domain-containing protein n=1 Tax=Tessaracoccus coleopterorum TaxID=2714950 RepID=UPI0018D378E9|nr:SHOCT domain-containing protein [Tessaracoccus coleopterorum]NHB85881.1 SHOCT domain-containing protein [Tessaracoccus coleopterorum]
MSFLQTIWDLILVFFSAFVFIASLVALVLVITDLFRDRALKGWAKALWILFLVFVPLVTSLVYLIARGDSMSARADAEARQNREQAESYIREVAGSSPADEITKAKALLDAGTITEAEFAALKAAVLTPASA